MPGSQVSQHTAVAFGDVPPETVGRLGCYNASYSPVRFDPTATADKLSAACWPRASPFWRRMPNRPCLWKKRGRVLFSGICWTGPRVIHGEPSF